MKASTDLGAAEPAFLFLHYLGGSGREWQEVVNLLSPAHRCVCADTAGFGQASSMSGFSVEEMVEALQELVQTLRLKQFILVGHSMTGKVAMAFATKYQSEILGMVLVAPSPPGPEPIEDEARSTMLSEHGTNAGAEHFVDNITFQPLPPMLRKQAMDDCLTASEAAWTAWLTKGSNEDWSSRIEIGTMKVLVVTGENDPSLAAPVQRKLTLPFLKKGKLIDLPQCGHLPPLEKPHELASILEDFAQTLVQNAA